MDIGVDFGNGGWVAVDGLGLPGLLYLRLRDVQGALRVSEFYLDASLSESVIDTQDLTSIPLARLEALINSYFADRVRQGIKLPAPDLSLLASHFASGLGTQAAVARQIQRGDWVISCLASQHIPPGDKSLDLAPGVRAMRVARGRRVDPERIRSEDREFRLTEGPKEGLTDEFLTSVARAYRAALARGERPNASIRDQLGGPQNGVSLKTVQRWVYTARQRKIMDPAGRRGKAD